MNERHTDAGRTDRDHYESSPSCGSAETARIMHAPGAHAAEENPATDAVDDLEDATMFRDTSTTLEVAQ